jgi:hypothetical protein
MKSCTYCGREGDPEARFCSRCGTALPRTDECAKDPETEVDEKEDQARRRLGSFLLLAKEHGMTMAVVASALSALKARREPIVAPSFLVVVLAVATAILWPAAWVGVAVAIVIEWFVVRTACKRFWPFQKQLTNWDQVSRNTAEAEQQPGWRVVAAFQFGRRVWARIVTWSVAVAAAVSVFLGVAAHRTYVTWRRAQPFHPLRPEEIGEYQRRVKILVKGDEEFQRNVCNLIKLLEDKAPGGFAFVQEHVKIIRPGGWYGYVEIQYNPPIVCLSNDGRNSLIMQAGTLVHEAAHIKADKQRRAGHSVVLGNVPADSNPIEEAEQRACDRIAAEAMRQLGLPSNELAEYLKRPYCGGEELQARLAGRAAPATNEPSSSGSNRGWSPVPLKEADPELWKEWDALRRGALPASPPKMPSPAGGSLPPTPAPTNGTKAKSP